MVWDMLDQGVTEIHELKRQRVNEYGKVGVGRRMTRSLYFPYEDTEGTESYKGDGRYGKGIYRRSD